MRWRKNSKTLRRARGTRSKNATTRIKWRRRTAHSRISGGDNYGDGDNGTKEGPGEKSKLAGSQVSAGTNAEHRDRGAYRRWQNNDYRARSLLHRHDPQDGGSARGHNRHRLDGAGTGTRDHDHVGRDNLHLVTAQRRRRLQDVRRGQGAHQYHRYAGSRRFYRRGRAFTPRT